MPKIDLAAIQAKIDANLPLVSESKRDMTSVTAENLPAGHPIWKLWSRFSEMYGHQWASQQGDEPNDTWVRGLDGLSAKDFGTGLRALLNRSETWPPNLIEFRQLCTNYSSNKWECQAHKIYEPERRIEDITSKEASIKAGEETLTTLKGIFNDR